METKYLTQRPPVFTVLVWSGNPEDLGELASYAATARDMVSWNGSFENAEWTFEIQGDGSVNCYLEYDGTPWFGGLPSHQKDFQLSFAVGAPVPEQFSLWNRGIDLSGYQILPESPTYNYTISEVSE